MWTVYGAPGRVDSIHSQACGATPSKLSFFTRRLWSRVSNALDISRKRAPTRRTRSRAVYQSFVQNNRAAVVECPLLNPDCRG